MKRMSILIAVAVLVIAAGIGFLIVRYVIKSRNSVMDGDGMINPDAISIFSYQRSGGSLGASYRIFTEDDQMTVESCDGNGYKTYKKTYTLPPQIIQEMQSIISKSDMRNWDRNFAEKEIFAYDAETTSVSVYFADGASVTFNSGLEIPEGGWEAVDEVVNLLGKIADK